MDQNKKASTKGQSKPGRNLKRCAAYKLRESQGNTAKTRRIARALKHANHNKKNSHAKQTCPGWMLTESGRAMRA